MIGGHKQRPTVKTPRDKYNRREDEDAGPSWKVL